MTDDNDDAEGQPNGDMMSMTAVALSSFLPMWQHRLEAVLALLRGEPGQQVAERFRMTRSDLYNGSFLPILDKGEHFPEVI
jgi:hypothetical protein